MISEDKLFSGAIARNEGLFARLRSGMASLLEPSTGGGAVPADSPVHFDMIREDGVFSRLSDQLGFAFTELRRDPAGFVKVLVSPDASDPDQIKTRQAAWALTVAVPTLVVGAFLLGIAAYYLLFGIVSPPTTEANVDDKQLYDITEVNAADMPKAPKADERSGGGGGGGKQEAAPPMKGKPPTPSLDPPIVAPTTHPPPNPPSLPMNPTVQVDPKLLPRNDDPNTIGDPNGVVGPPSDGPGSGSGIGTGKGGGVGSGDGTGLGPGHGWNTGGGDPRIGGGDGDDQKAKAIQTKARIVNSPRPNYTEQARQNKTQGNVVVKALLGADGRVKSASVVRGLPDGLNEKAIEAVYKLSFTPARNGLGNAVDQWVTVSVNFTIR